MPLISKRGAQAVKGYGMFTDFGSSEWVWTYRLNPGPSATAYFSSTNVSLYIDKLANAAFIFFPIPLSYSPTSWASYKSVKIGANNVLSYPNANSAYNVNNISEIHSVNGLGNTSMVGGGSGYSTTYGTWRPAIYDIDANANPTTAYYPAMDYAGTSYALALSYAQDLANIGGTFTYISSSQVTTTPIRYVFSSITKTAAQFGKYLVTSAGASVILRPLYNKNDGFIYANCVDSTSGNSRGVLLKYNTSGVLQWQRILTENFSVQSMTFSGADILVSGVSPTLAHRIIRYNSSGTILSTKEVPAGAIPQSTLSHTDSKDYFFLLGGTTSTVSSILVLNSSLDPVRNMRITWTGAPNLRIRDIQTDPYGNMYLYGYLWVGATAPYDVTQFVIKMPINSGTNRTYTIGPATAAVTEVALPSMTNVTATDAAGTLVETAVTMGSINTTTWTSSATSITSSVTVL